MARKVHPVTIAVLQRGETLGELAERVGVTKNTMHAALRTGGWPRLRSAISEDLGRPIQELFPEVAS
jgi:lambda repressor-like predicted transcriptional regulator